MSKLSLIICATPRSGSYLLSDILEQCGLPFAEEWLTPFHLSSRRKAYGEKESLDYVEFLKLLTVRERNGGIFAMKLMLQQMLQMKDELSVPQSGELEHLDWYERFCHIFPNPKFIFISRENKPAQAVSWLRAYQTGHWVKKKEEEAGEHIEPVYSYLGICDARDFLVGENSVWEGFFHKHSIEPLRVGYENLLQNSAAVLQEIFDYLEIPSPATGEIDNCRRFLPMATPLNHSWVNQFKEEGEKCDPDAASDRVDELSRLEISNVEIPECCEVNKRYRYRVTVRVSDGHAPDPRGRPDGSGWLRVNGIISDGDPDSCFFSELRKTSPTELQAVGVLPELKKPGEFTMKICLSSGSLSYEEIEAADGYTMSIVAGLPEKRAAARKLLGEISDLRNGWQYLEWFGYFLDDKFPWIYHADHGWLYFKPEIEKGGVYHVLDRKIGWVEINPRAYPDLTVLKSGKVIRFQRRENEIRFFTTDSGSTIEFEINQPESIPQMGADG